MNNSKPIERPFRLYSVGGKLSLAHVSCGNLEGWRDSPQGRVFLDIRLQDGFECVICHRVLAGHGTLVAAN